MNSFLPVRKQIAKELKNLPAGLALLPGQSVYSIGIGLNGLPLRQ